MVYVEMEQYRACVLLLLLLLWMEVGGAGGVSPPVVVTAAGHVISPDSDLDVASWIEALYGIRLDADERRCAEQQKVLHRGSNQCFQLYDRGPCGRREWLVFDRAEAAAAASKRRLVAACRRRECAPSWGFDLRSNKCFRHKSCPPPTAFHYTLFGDGQCLCNATAAAFAGTNSCQELFRERVCPRGKILAPRYTLLGGMDATCAPDPCLEGSPSSSSSSNDNNHHGQGSPSHIVFTPRQSDSATTIPTGFPGDVIHFDGNNNKRIVTRVPSRVASLSQKNRRREAEEFFFQPLRRDLRRGVSGGGGARVLNHLLPNAVPAPTAAADRLNVLLPHQDEDSVVPVPVPVPPVPERLHVKYPDGSAACLSATELNATCDLQLKALFSSASDLSAVRVPLCVEKWFRFAVGRVGKAEECVSNDDGVCAAKVNVVSSEPFDWDFE